MLATGQCWRYRAPEGHEASRLVIGAIVTFAGDTRVLCVSVTGAGHAAADGATEAATVPFLPLSEAAFAATVTELDGTAEVAADFAAQFETWRSDPRGHSVFTVPFEGSLDRIIARQMAAIVATRGGG